MQTEFTPKMPEVCTYPENGDEKGTVETEVTEVWYPEQACEGAVIQCGRITQGRPFGAGSN